MVLVSLGLAAQNKGQSANEPYSTRTAVKWNPFALSFGKISLSGEYNYRQRKSVTAYLGVPLEKSLNKFLDLGPSGASFNMKTFSIGAGYRMYMGKKPMRGFYFEPVLQHVSNNSTISAKFDISSSSNDFTLTSTYHGYGLAAQLGLQFVIGNRVTLDWYLLGPAAYAMDHRLVARDNTSTTPWDPTDAADAEQSIRDFINDIPQLRNKVAVNVDANSRTVTTDLKTWIPGIRGGITIGVAF